MLPDCSVHVFTVMGKACTTAVGCHVNLYPRIRVRIGDLGMTWQGTSWQGYKLTGNPAVH